MKKNTRIYLLSIAFGLGIVLTFFFIQSFVVIKVFEPRMLIVPFSLAATIGILLGKVLVLREQLAERNRLFSALADFALEFTYFRKISGEYEYVSPACKQLTGYEQEFFYSQPNFMDSLIHPDDMDVWKGHIHNINGEGVAEVVEFRIINRSGEIRWVEHLCSTVKDAQGNTIGVRSTNVDITQRKAYEQQIEFSAKYDHLTMLPNRRWLMKKLEDRIAETLGSKSHFAVMFLDLDRFKFINDTFGHAIGDTLLRMIADQFKFVVPQNGCEPMFVSRFGGDEFVIVADMVQGEELKHAAESILALLDRSFVVDVHDFNVSGSIGIAVFPYDGATPEDLIKNADAAMYKAKREGKNNIQFYSADLASEMSDFYILEKRLKLAVERDEFVLHYQPQVDLASGKIRSVEALLRWNSPDNGLVPPLQFIPVAEETGLIRAIGELVFRKACAQWRVWADQGIDLKMAVNVSPIQFRDDAFVIQLEKLLEEMGMPPASLEIEITEGVLMGSAEKALGKLNALRDMGVSIAIDDFGTGYSSLEYLKDLPINCLKIDGSFVREIQSGQRDEAIVRTIEALGRNLQMSTVAEGIEEEGQLALLKEIGCTLGQGYFISRPMPAEALTPMLRDSIS
ncbi:MAG: GGDEF and EAL domain-containing protein [Gammaproteobacteria bacterium]|nr:GGDEF and EAL domain-containing protein [Gammaproteobacteria bacterium]MBU1730749.1 GGDEF and EAL domain-containing protein [Gammaproteobacteria bacterium]MBU1891295.1 GGDEF and EAL domain-containing protein [Gammaproteobacteria bacterium]